MNNENRDSLEKGLLDTLKDENIENVCKDFSELAIDALLTDGILREIPVINSVVGLAKAGFSVRDRLFIEKVIRFINPLGKYSETERKEFLEALDEKELKKAIQSAVLYLERLDSLEKPEMLGKAFESYMKGQITFKQMMYFFHFIDIVFIMVWNDYFDAIKNMGTKKSFFHKISIDDAKALEKVGIYNLKEEPELDYDQNIHKPYLRTINKKLVISDAGRDFIKIVFGFWVDEKNEFWRNLLDVKIPND